jgi:hypothetical protein
VAAPWCGSSSKQSPRQLTQRFHLETNLARPAERVVAFYIYNQRGTAQQYIKEGKRAIKWTRLSCRPFVANAVRLQLHVLGYSLGNFMRTLAMPNAAEPWSLTSLREKLIKIGAKVVSHSRYTTFQMAEVAVPRQMFQEILMSVAQLREPSSHLEANSHFELLHSFELPARDCRWPFVGNRPCQ